MSFVCLQFYKHNCLNILADDIYLLYTCKKSIEMTQKGSGFMPSCGTYKPRKLGHNLSPYLHILVFMYLSS